MENRHSGDGSTTAVFISAEERAAGLDPATVAARIARESSQAAVQHHHGVHVQMVNKGQAPVAHQVVPNVVATVAREVAPAVLTGLEALRFALAHPGVPLTYRHPVSGLLSQVDPAAAFADGLPTELELESYHVQVDALGRPMLAAVVPPAPVDPPTLTGAPFMSAPSGAGGHEHTAETVIPEAHSMAAFQRPPGQLPTVKTREYLAPAGTAVSVTHAGPYVRIRLTPPGETE